MALSVGDKIGPYEILAAIGAGGMGEVYRARDAKLNRDVAIKVLPSGLAGDAQYMARFEREAQMLAALHHPNVASIFGLEHNALVMELVEGSTLAERIALGAIPFDEALPIARQIAEGLEAAHERGVIHRDLKPANIKITPAGAVKLLDFGLAKTAGDMSSSAGGANPTISPTMSLAMTQAGMILGTAAYMSPEQARGKPVDKRADIWAFGVVVYEMLAGKQLFGGGETVTDTLAAVVRETIDLNTLPADTPAGVRRLLDRCLRRDVKTRLRDIGEAGVLLDDVIVGKGEEAVSAAPASAPVSAKAARRPLLPWSIAAIFAAAALGLGALAFWPKRPLPMVRLDANLGTEFPLAIRNGATLFDISRDGTRVAFIVDAGSGRSKLALRFLHQDRATIIDGTDGANSPFFSPDGEWIGFHADGKLKKIAITGGAPLVLCDAISIRGASWGDDGYIVTVFGNTAGLSRVPAAGGNPVELTKLEEGTRTHRWPQVVAGEQVALFTAGPSTNYDEGRIEAVSLKDGRVTTVLKNGHSARYLPSGHLVYQNQATLFAVRFDIRRLTVSGTAVPILEGAGLSGNGGGLFAVSRSGSLVYTQGTQRGLLRSIVSLDEKGTFRELHDEKEDWQNIRLSPDGKRLAVQLAKVVGREELWVKDLERGSMTRISFLDGRSIRPTWTPDSKSILFRNSGSAGGLYIVPADGSGPAQRIGEESWLPRSVSPDGKRVALDLPAKGGRNIYTAALNVDLTHPSVGKPEPFLTEGARQDSGVFSPDGRFLAYHSSESGPSQVYVRPFPGPGGRWQVSPGGGQYPAWGGHELFYETNEAIMAVPYTVSGGAFRAGVPRVVTKQAPSVIGVFWGYDVSADGKKLVMARPQEDATARAAGHLVFLFNFFDELRRRTAEKKGPGPGPR